MAKKLERQKTFRTFAVCTRACGDAFPLNLLHGFKRNMTYDYGLYFVDLELVEHARDNPNHQKSSLASISPLFLFVPRPIILEKNASVAA